MSVQHVQNRPFRPGVAVAAVATVAGMARVAALCLSLAAAASLQGCATAAKPDPMESWNRKVFAFNDAVDENLLKPVAIGYKKVTPEPVRTGFTNFVNNIKDIWSTVNLFLQGRFTDGTLSVMRVSINSTLGLAGLLDIATPMQLERPHEDLGQTFGVWGAKPGAYIVWPILGPSTVRDSIALPADSYFSASVVGEAAAQKNLLRLWQGVNLRAGLLDATNLLNDVALDKYAFVRDAYLQRRQNLIYEGDPPAPEEEAYDPYDDEAPEPVAETAPAASGANEGRGGNEGGNASGKVGDLNDGAPGTAPAAPSSSPSSPGAAASSPDA